MSSANMARTRAVGPPRVPSRFLSLGLSDRVTTVVTMSGDVVAIPDALCAPERAILRAAAFSLRQGAARVSERPSTNALWPEANAGAAFLRRVGAPPSVARAAFGGNQPAWPVKLAA